MFLRPVSCFLLLLLCTTLRPAAAADDPPPVATGQAVALTLYDDFALVRDQRTFRLTPGEQTVRFPGISAGIQPETALLRGEGVRVLEQDFSHDQLSLQSLLEQYEGREVLVVTLHPQTGERSYDKALLLSVSGGVLLRIGDRVESVRPDRIVFPDVPLSLQNRPTLTMRVLSTVKGGRQLELSYLTSGLSWQTDYVAELSDDGTRLDLRAWVTLTNESGVEYRKARVQLVAGEVNRVMAGRMEERLFKGRAMAAAAPASPMQREKLFGYHLYSLPRPVTLHRREQKQVAFLHAASVSCRRELVLRGRGSSYTTRVGTIGARQRVAEVLVLNNSAAAGLGMPMPAGVVRVYSRDAGGILQFVGEDQMNHTPKEGVVRLALGSAFDLSAEKKQVTFKKLTGTPPSSAVYESGYQITLHNGGGTEKTVQVVEEIPGDWTMLAESLPHTRKDSRTAAWSVPVPARGSTVLTYRVRVRY